MILPITLQRDNSASSAHTTISDQIHGHHGGNNLLLLIQIVLLTGFQTVHTSAASGQKNGQSDQKRN